jgi:Flp pilus assembly pilin Flp
MKKASIKKLVKEIAWFVALILIAALVEFAIIETFDLHPVLSIKIQGLIGLVILGYGFRMVVRLWKVFNSPSDAVKNKNTE